MDKDFNDNDICLICRSPINLYSYGKCLHTICYKCSVKMRILCEQTYCPICRSDLPKVIFAKKYIPEEVKFLNTKNKDVPRWGIYFESQFAKDLSFKLLSHECPKCRKEFSDFNDLKYHLKFEHDYYYCDICIHNLKLFTFERRVYKHYDLLKHLKEGDRNISNDNSQKGHPICEFCQKRLLSNNSFSDFSARFLDHEELFKHLRKDHYFCHFCDVDGKNKYYDTYPILRDHFKNEHYLCEEGDCKYEKFVTAFRTEIDYKAHILEKHTTSYNRNSQRLLKTIDLVQNRPHSNINRRREFLESGTLMPCNNNESSNNNVVIDTNINFFEDDYLPYRFQPGSSSDFPSLSTSSTQESSNFTPSNTIPSTAASVSTLVNTCETTATLNAGSEIVVTNFLPKAFSKTVKSNWGAKMPSINELAFPTLPFIASTKSQNSSSLFVNSSSLKSTNLTLSSKQSTRTNNHTNINDSVSTVANSSNNNFTNKASHFPVLPLNISKQPSKVNGPFGNSNNPFFIPTLSTAISSKLKSTSSSSSNNLLASKKNSKSNAISKKRVPSKKQANSDSEDDNYRYNPNEYESFGIINKNVKSAPINEFKNLRPFVPNNLISDFFPDPRDAAAPFSNRPRNSFEKFPQLCVLPSTDNRVRGKSGSRVSVSSNGGPTTTLPTLNKIVATSKLRPPLILPPSCREPDPPQEFIEVNSFQEFPTLLQGPARANPPRSIYNDIFPNSSVPPFQVNNKSVMAKMDKRAKDEQNLKNLIMRLN